MPKFKAGRGLFRGNVKGLTFALQAVGTTDRRQAAVATGEVRASCRRTAKAAVWALIARTGGPAEVAGRSRRGAADGNRPDAHPQRGHGRPRGRRPTQREGRPDRRDRSSQPCRLVAGDSRRGDRACRLDRPVEGRATSRAARELARSRPGAGRRPAGRPRRPRPARRRRRAGCCSTSWPSRHEPAGHVRAAGRRRRWLDLDIAAAAGQAADLLADARAGRPTRRAVRRVPRPQGRRRRARQGARRQEAPPRRRQARPARPCASSVQDAKPLTDALTKAGGLDRGPHRLHAGRDQGLRRRGADQGRRRSRRAGLPPQGRHLPRLPRHRRGRRAGRAGHDQHRRQRPGRLPRRVDPDPEQGGQGGVPRAQGRRRSTTRCYVGVKTREADGKLYLRNAEDKEIAIAGEGHRRAGPSRGR